MAHFGTQKSLPRYGRANPVTLILLSAIFLALVVIIVLLLRRRESGAGSSAADSATSTSSSRRDPPTPIENPGRITQALKLKTYEVVAKGGFDSRVEDKDWGIKAVAHIVFEYEMESVRTIESNDGHTVVERRRYDAIRAGKLLTKVESVTFDLGVSDKLILAGVELVSPGTGTQVIAAKIFAENVLREGVQAVADDASAKAFAQIDSLTGKEVRITYVDGKGVTSIEPLHGITLSREERNFIEASAVLADCYILPELDSKPGDEWKVDGSQFTDFIDPTLRAVPRGAIFIRREANENKAATNYAVLSVKSGFVELEASDTSQARYGSLRPRGTLRFNLTDEYITDGELQASVVYERVSKDHLLFEARFRSKPEIKITYSCKMR